MKEESTFNLDIEYNSEGIWNNLMSLRSESLRSYNIPVPIKKVRPLQDKDIWKRRLHVIQHDARIV